MLMFNIQGTIRVVTLQQTDTVAIIHSVSLFPAGTQRKDHIRWRTGAQVIRRPQGGTGGPVKEQHEVRVTDRMLVTSRWICVIVKSHMLYTQTAPNAQMDGCLQQRPPVSLLRCHYTKH